MAFSLAYQLNLYHPQFWVATGKYTYIMGLMPKEDKRRNSDWGGARLGAGRKKARATVCGRVDQEVQEKLRAVAKKRKLTLSRLVEELLLKEIT